MTWQRIDENTYIDDSLVTCAEYQLFIDEMREQKRYYQPDHWSSYEFPKGKAHEPVIGVRQLDAVAFCEWLSNRENEEWIYRLPSSNEAEDYKLRSSPTKLGYWVQDTDSHAFGFAWISNISDDILMLPEDFIRLDQQDVDLSIELTKALLDDIKTSERRLPFLLRLENLIVLRDRIVGHSPAIEGIRLVKERK